MLGNSQHISVVIGLAAVFGAGCVNSIVPALERPWVRHVIDNAPRGADGVRLADANGDGLPDIVTPWEESGRVRAYLNPGSTRSTRPWPAVTVGEVGSPEDAVFWDVDGDGAIDVVTATEGDVETVWLHWAPPDPSRYLDSHAWMTQPIPATVHAREWMFCMPMDVDSRHGIDLVLGAKGPDAQIGWLESPVDPRDLAAWRWHSLYDAGWIMSLAIADMDGDGDSDIVASDRKGDTRGCLWLENPGVTQVRTAPWPVHHISTNGRNYMFLALADLDQDAMLDVVAATSTRELLFHRRQSSDGTAWESFPIRLPDCVGTGKAVAVADMDEDGRLDIVVTCENAQDGRLGVVWLSYRTQVTASIWDVHDISGPEGVKYDLVRVLDLDGDIDLDVLTCEERTNLGVIWYENPIH
ncbi:MAG: VCBS repeat-containing protein [Phycisphaerae bacterium]|nr:VCBS repeat-containing protein [Phycisphaerae bacterium]